MIEATGLRLTLGERTLFRDLDLRVGAGSVTAIVGPNGAGKSSLLRSLCGLLEPGGSVLLEGSPLRGLSPRARARKVAYLPQQTAAAPGLTVRDVVMLGRLPHRTRLAGPSEHDRTRAMDSLDRVGMTAFADRALHTLSGGERQRVMLARMLATEAGVMLLDEPTAALDVRHALGLLTTLRTLADGGRAVVLALHDLPLADAFADQIVCLPGDGSFELGPTQDVLTPERLQAVFGATFVRDAEGALHLRAR